MAKRKEKDFKSSTVKLYPFDFNNNETYEPTEQERDSLAMRTLPTKRPLMKIDYMQWERYLVETGKYQRGDLKSLTFSEALELKNRVEGEQIRKCISGRKRLVNQQTINVIETPISISDKSKASSKQWPPKGYTALKDVKKKYDISRSTIDDWAKKEGKEKLEKAGDRIKDPHSNQIAYHNDWLKEHI